MVTNGDHHYSFGDGVHHWCQNIAIGAMQFWYVSCDLLRFKTIIGYVIIALFKVDELDKSLKFDVDLCIFRKKVVHKFMVDEVKPSRWFTDLRPLARVQVYNHCSR
jgi:hypothetical protein